MSSRRFPPPWSVDEADSNLERASSRLFRGLGPPAGCALVAFRSILKMEERSCGYFCRLPSCLS
jgi:hypothetical protein